MIVGWKVVLGVKAMYNLEVAQDHTFTVGVGQWVVHNMAGSASDCGGDSSTGDNSDLSTKQQQLIQNSIDNAQTDANKTHHIFDNPSSDHQWKLTGLDQSGNWGLIQQTLENNSDAIGTSNKPFEVTSNFGDYAITVRGNYVGGVLYIGTAWVNSSP